MIKHWQTNQDYHCFLTNAKTTFDSSERVRLQSELAPAREKLRLFDTDAAMRFLVPFFSNTGRPASNQPQLLRSFILFFLLVSMELTSPSLTAWVKRLKSDRVLASLIGCSLNSLPPLGSYYDFMNRLWNNPDHSLYMRDKLLSPDWNHKKPAKPNGWHQKASENDSSITDSIVSRILGGKDIPFNFEARLQKLFYAVAVLPSLKCGLIPGNTLTVSGDGTSVHTHSSPNGHIRLGLTMLFLHRNMLPCQGILLTPMPHGGGTVTSIPFTLAILCSSFPVTTLYCIPISHCCSALPAPNDMIPSLFLLPSMNWKNICLLFL